MVFLVDVEKLRLPSTCRKIVGVKRVKVIKVC